MLRCGKMRHVIDACDVTLYCTPTIVSSTIFKQSFIVYTILSRKQATWQSTAGRQWLSWPRRCSATWCMTAIATVNWRTYLWFALTSFTIWMIQVRLTHCTCTLTCVFALTHLLYSLFIYAWYSPVYLTVLHCTALDYTDCTVLIHCAQIVVLCGKRVWSHVHPSYASSRSRRPWATSKTSKAG